MSEQIETPALSKQQQAETVKADIRTIVEWFNLYRLHNNRFISENGLVATTKSLDPYFLFAGGWELGKQFSKDWQMATKMATAKKALKAMVYSPDPNQIGFDLTIGGEPVEEKSKAYFWVPGLEVPNKWTGNKYSQCKTSLTLLLNFGCNVDGTIKRVWAALVRLTGNPDGKSGDWKFSADSKDNAFSTLTLTKEVAGRPSYAQLWGQSENDYGVKSLDAKIGMKVIGENIK